MDMGSVLRGMKKDPTLRFTREGWNGKNQYIMIQNPTQLSKMTRPYIYIKTVQNDLVPWLASQTDILADDWVIVPYGKVDNQPNPEKVKEARDDCFDAVNRPAHYCKDRKIQPIDVIEDWKLNFNTGSALKYISRAGRKDDKIQDLEKAIFYLKHEVMEEKKRRELKSLNIDEGGVIYTYPTTATITIKDMPIAEKPSQETKDPSLTMVCDRLDEIIKEALKELRV